MLRDHIPGNHAFFLRFSRDRYSSRIRGVTGKTVSTYVEYIEPGADVHLLPSGTLHVDVLAHWKSPVTRVNYPSGWYLEINSQQLQVKISLTPELKDQELVAYQSTGNTY